MMVSDFSKKNTLESKLIEKLFVLKNQRSTRIWCEDFLTLNIFHKNQKGRIFYPPPHWSIISGGSWDLGVADKYTKKQSRKSCPVFTMFVRSLRYLTLRVPGKYIGCQIYRTHFKKISPGGAYNKPKEFSAAAGCLIPSTYQKFWAGSWDPSYLWEHLLDWWLGPDG